MDIHCLRLLAAFALSVHICQSATSGQDINAPDMSKHALPAEMHFVLNNKKENQLAKSPDEFKRFHVQVFRLVRD
jgi:hypothetical protein